MQNETSTPFTPFSLPPAPQPALGADGIKKSRESRKSTTKKSVRKKRAVAQTPAASAPRKPRKVRTAKLDVATALQAFAGLSEEDGKFLSGVVQAMQAFPARQRRRIAQALARMCCPG